MALPANRSLRQVQVDCFSPSVGASPVPAVARSPSRGTIVKVGGALVAGLSTSDCSVAVKVNGTAVRGSPFTMTQAGSAEGSVFSMIPTGFAPALHLPATDTNALIAMLSGMLGLGTMRTVEKMGGKAK
jgi:hypothetical protein